MRSLLTKAKLAVLLTLFVSSVAYAVRINGTLEKAKLEPLTRDPTCQNGRIYYNTANHTVKVCTDGSWSTPAATAFTPENAANKSTDTTLGGALPSNIYYPSQLASKTYIDAKVSASIAAGFSTATDLGGSTASNSYYPSQLASKTYTDSKISDTESLITSTFLAGFSTATDLGGSTPSDVLYPSQKATKTYIDLYSGLTTTEVTSATTMSVNNTYVVNGSAKVPLTLPSEAVIGSKISIHGLGAYGWSVYSNASASVQKIVNQSQESQSSSGSSVALASSVYRYDSILLTALDSVGGTWSAMLGGAPILLGNYWGDGTDGNLDSTDNVTLTVGDIYDTYDAGCVVKKYNNFTLNSGHTYTLDHAARCLVLYVKGNAVIDGVISMTAKGAYADPTAAGSSDGHAVRSSGLNFCRIASGSTSTESSPSTAVWGTGTALVAAEANQSYPAGKLYCANIIRQGADGGAEKCCADGGCTGNSGSADTGKSGGGGSGGTGQSYPSACGGAGSYGSCFGGGSAGGGAADSGANGVAGTAWSGPGGNGGSYSHEGGGGAGNPKGLLGAGGADGVGGTVVLLVGGNLTFGNTGRIQATGSTGRSRGASGSSGGGGGSGGGVAVILYGGSLSSPGSEATLTGGAGGSGWSHTGGAGGAGSQIGPIKVDP